MKNTTLSIFLILLLTDTLAKVGDVSNSEGLDAIGDNPFHNFHPRIINGQEADPHSIPSQVYIMITGIFGNSWTCSGSIISSRYILTSGSCVYEGYYALIYLGSHNISTLEAQRLIVHSSNFKIHEHYSSATMSYDIALIELNDALDFNEYYSAIRLPSSNDDGNYEGGIVRISGWGLTETGSHCQVLMEINGTVISRGECMRYYNTLPEYNLCTLGENGMGVCDGDFGGPIISDNIQIALVSWTIKGCNEGYPTVAINVFKLLSWIKDNSDL